MAVRTLRQKSWFGTAVAAAALIALVVTAAVLVCLAPSVALAASGTADGDVVCIHIPISDEELLAGARPAPVSAEASPIFGDSFLLMSGCYYTATTVVEDDGTVSYELDYAGAVRFRRADFDHEKAVGEIAKLRRAMSKLGPVSLDSIDMYKETKGRHDELAAQRDDMRKAQADIMEIIATLSKEMQERFDREFKKINANFQTIFSEMFGGGTGRLEVDLDNAEDPLEAGIEIYAEPPGKNLKNLSQLSGGEQALTAICILFAILRLRPMPFCILDEIDAALDESNVDIFARYLKRFSDSTQFIVITHRKPSMEQADMLYGVTMQELGVSDVVSVSLKEAVKHSSSD